MHPVQSLTKSRKAWIATGTILLDAATVLALFFVGKYAPQVLEDVRLVVAVLAAVWNGLAAVWINSIATEDAAALANGKHRTQITEFDPARQDYADSRSSEIDERIPF